MKHTPPGAPATKRLLVALSHVLEQAALAAAEDGPLVVVAMFQRLPYFARERAVYQRIAGTAAVTVVGLVGPLPAEAPAGVHLVELADDDPLAREWTVAVLTPRFGAVLRAYDREQISGEEATLEAGRLFDARWSWRRDDALHEVLRLAGTLGTRLPEAAREQLGDVLDRVRDLPAGPGEARGAAGLRQLAEALRREQLRTRQLVGQVAAAQRGGTETEEPVELLDELGYRRWAGEHGVTASGTLPVALIGVRITHTGNVPEPFGRRDQHRGNQLVARALAEPLGPADRMVRLAADEFLLVLPARPYEETVELAQRLHADLGELDQRYPFLSIRATLAVGVSRRRPLPVDQVRAALDWALAEEIALAALPVETAGSTG